MGHGNERQWAVVVNGPEDGHEGIGSAFLMAAWVWVAGPARLIATRIGQAVEQGVDHHGLVGRQLRVEASHSVSKWKSSDAAVFSLLLMACSGGRGIDLLDLSLGRGEGLAVRHPGQQLDQGGLHCFPLVSAGLQRVTHSGMHGNDRAPVQIPGIDQCHQQREFGADQYGFSHPIVRLMSGKPQRHADLGADRLDAVNGFVRALGGK
ncbi:hypothetical protein GCM10022223_36380 [Kineosporia mesophila]|uniref:Uncharacterized protein n=1 Tax=Kineosporia mesophila TaxID=566012 RepID=A0ABP6ZPZ1_9ACTN